MKLIAESSPQSLDAYKALGPEAVDSRRPGYAIGLMTKPFEGAEDMQNEGIPPRYNEVQR